MQKISHLFTRNPVSKWLLYCYIRVLFSTYRLRVINQTDQALPLNKSRGLFCGWHEEMIAFLFFLQKNGARGHLVSDGSFEGTMGSFVSRKFGLIPLMSNGKTSFMRRALEALEMNGRLYTIGDGTHGPAKQLQPDVQFLAQRSQVPLVMVSCRATTAVSLWKRWDSFKIPLPFSTITVTITKQ
jgi:lysophospholipid acyltransferase (LPLAT)-like uncharacterized protein